MTMCDAEDSIGNPDCKIYFEKINEVPEIFEQPIEETIFFDLTNNLTNALFDSKDDLYYYLSKEANDTDGPGEI